VIGTTPLIFKLPRWERNWSNSLEGLKAHARDRVWCVARELCLRHIYTSFVSDFSSFARPIFNRKRRITTNNCRHLNNEMHWVVTSDRSCIPSNHLWCISLCMLGRSNCMLEHSNCMLGQCMLTVPVHVHGQTICIYLWNGTATSVYVRIVVLSLRIFQFRDY